MTRRDGHEGMSVFILHGFIETLPVGVREEPRGVWFDVVDHLVDGHEREPHAVDQLAGELMSIDAIKVYPPNHSLHTTQRNASHHHVNHP